MAVHPYRDLPVDQFWSSGAATVAAADLDPMRVARFTFSPADPVASAGSCFAQHIAHFLQHSGYTYLQAETPLTADEPVFSARFGNIYTVRQLHQVLLAAYGLHRPAVPVWQRADARFIDPLRPHLFPAGFASADDVVQARATHLAAVRRVLQDCRVFVITLGLTEAWLAPDGTALPTAPGVLGAQAEAEFHNFTVAEMRQDMDKFLADLVAVNPGVRVVLSVSPVPLVATYLPRNVMVSNAYSKAALRVVAEEAEAAHTRVAYFPAYEIITAPQVAGRYFEADLRNVTAEGVAHVMRIFARHYMRTNATPIETETPHSEKIALSDEARERYSALADVLCDEDLLEPGQGN